MVFCTPFKAAQCVGSHSQLLSPYYGRELQRAGQFLCTLIEKEIACAEPARESYNRIFPKLFADAEPLPAGPARPLAAEYFYGSFLLSIAEADQEKRAKYYAGCIRMEQQLCQEILRKPSVDDICTYTLRAAYICYLRAAAMFLYLPKSDLQTKSIQLDLRQALYRYNNLNTLFDKLDAVPEITPARDETLAELHFLSSIGYRTGYHRKLKEVKRDDPELMNIKNIKRVASDITYALSKYIPQNRHSFKELWEDMKNKNAQFKKIREGVMDFYSEDKHKILRQDVLLGLMRCYALRGDYQKIKETADCLEETSKKPEYFPLEEIAACAHRLELGAQENQISSKKCRPFVPRIPERVAQQTERFISAYEHSSKRLVARNPFFGDQEWGREVVLVA